MCLSGHLSVDVWIIRVWGWVQLVWTFEFRSLPGHRFSFPLSEEPGKEHLSHVISVGLTIEGPGSFSKQLHYFVSSPVGYEPSNFSMFSPAIVIVCLSIIAGWDKCSGISSEVYFAFPCWLRMLGIFSHAYCQSVLEIIFLLIEEGCVMWGIWAPSMPVEKMKSCSLVQRVICSLLHGVGLECCHHDLLQPSPLLMTSLFLLRSLVVF